MGRRPLHHGIRADRQDYFVIVVRYGQVGGAHSVAGFGDGSGEADGFVPFGDGVVGDGDGEVGGQSAGFTLFDDHLRGIGGRNVVVARSGEGGAAGCASRHIYGQVSGGGGRHSGFHPHRLRAAVFRQTGQGGGGGGSVGETEDYGNRVLDSYFRPGHGRRRPAHRSRPRQNGLLAHFREVIVHRGRYFKTLVPAGLLRRDSDGKRAPVLVGGEISPRAPDGPAAPGHSHLHFGGSFKQGGGTGEPGGYGNLPGGSAFHHRPLVNGKSDGGIIVLHRHRRRRFFKPGRSFQQQRFRPFHDRILGNGQPGQLTRDGRGDGPGGNGHRVGRRRGIGKFGCPHRTGARRVFGFHIQRNHRVGG